MQALFNGISEKNAKFIVYNFATVSHKITFFNLCVQKLRTKEYEWMTEKK